MQTLPAEIIAHILGYTHQYHMITIWVCRLWRDIILSSHRSGSANYICDVAITQNKWQLVRWLITQSKRLTHDIYEGLLVGYYSGCISRCELLDMVHDKSDVFVDVDNSRMFKLVVHHRDAELFNIFYEISINCANPGSFIIYSKPDLIWLMSQGVELSDDLGWDMMYRSCDMTAWVFSQCSEISLKRFKHESKFLPIDALEVALQHGCRFNSPIDYEFMDDHVEKGDVLETLKLLLKYHNWGFYKENLLDSFDGDDACCDYINAWYPNEPETYEL
jgi:hypothetical protein